MTSAGAWESWSGLTTSHPRQVLAPAQRSDVADAVVAARANGLRVKMVGSGHSFTDVAQTDGLLLRPDRLTGITAVDRDAMTVTVLAGTPLHVLNEKLGDLGLALHNMGDVDRQTVAGAIATGTHGTGGRQASLSAQVVGVELVTGDGSVRHARAEGTPEEAHLLEAARLGLGALGIATTVTFSVEPAFLLSAVEAPMTWADVVDGFDDLADGNEHFEAYWFPHSDRMLTKRNNRTAVSRPLRTWRSWVDDELLSNTAFGLVNKVGNVAPAAVPGLARLTARALSGRTFSDTSHRVFVSPRRVVFREMEYAVPREVGMQALTEARALIEKRGWRISFPVEIRHAPRDDIWLSTAHDRASVYLAFHVNARTDHTEYFTGVEQVLKAYDGRPHWGKLHTRTAADLAATYPRHADFVALRDGLDPDRLFTNRYLDRVLGP
jgi:L-gulono-1,4-lactone dehydrogenase